MSDYCDLDVRFFAPPEHLSGCFSIIYRAEVRIPGDGIVRDILMPEWTSLRVFRGGSPDASLPGGTSIKGARMVATGPTTLGTDFRLGPTRMWGIGLFPEGLARLTRIDASQIANRMVDGEKDPAFAKVAPVAQILLDGAADDQHEFERIIAFFTGRQRDNRHVEDIRRIHRSMIDESVSSVEELREGAGLPLRQLERLCSRYFGFTPKALLRRQRFVRSLTNFIVDRPLNWSGAMDLDYYDQAHFIREFKAFMGMTPREYGMLPHPIQSVFMVERAKHHGSPAQTLDRPL